MSIGKIILQQIHVQDQSALLAWGVTDILYLPDGIDFGIRTPQYPLNIRVRILLNVMDTYDIEVFEGEYKDTTILKKANDVYNDMLIGVMDDLIEGEQKEVICF